MEEFNSALKFVCKMDNLQNKDSILSFVIGLDTINQSEVFEGVAQLQPKTVSNSCVHKSKAVMPEIHVIRPVEMTKPVQQVDMSLRMDSLVIA